MRLGDKPAPDAVPPYWRLTKDDIQHLLKKGNWWCSCCNIYPAKHAPNCPACGKPKD